MNDEVNYKNNPLHGVSLKNLLTELVSHYGFDILFAYLNINCFKTNPSIDSSVKFLKKTEWARQKVESFYLYQFKNLPRASAQQFELPPRDRIIPTDQVPGSPAELSLEDGQRLQKLRAQQALERRRSAGPRQGRAAGKQPDGRKRNPREQDKGARKKEREAPTSSSTGAEKSPDPWAKWKK